MNDKKATSTTGLAGALGLVKKYSFVLVFLAILIVYAVANGGLTLNAGMNVLRHSAVIGTIAINYPLPANSAKPGGVTIDFVATQPLIPISAGYAAKD